MNQQQGTYRRKSIAINIVFDLSPQLDISGHRGKGQKQVEVY